mmetsp:Transcript_26806/g.25849  ORF Transcript_26806/g.25849 Transcript_26806/m.25849 type:complete len:158 (+) Transcript_26806:664-1137(+)
MFSSLKKQDDDIRRQVLEIMKKAPKANPNYLKDSQIASPFKGESPSNSLNNSFKKKGTRFIDETYISEIKQNEDGSFKKDEEEDEIFSEELYRKALADAEREQERLYAKKTQQNMGFRRGDQIEAIGKTRNKTINTHKRVEYSPTGAYVSEKNHQTF